MKLADINFTQFWNSVKTFPHRLWQALITFPGRFIGDMKNSQGRKKWFFRGLMVVGALISLLLLVFLFTWLGFFGSVPDKNALLGIRQPEASKIYSADGTLMGKYYTKNRNTLNYEEIPPAFMSSLIATEDSRFWKHTGIDFRSWARVFVKRMIMGQESAGGGSTLSQQLAKNLFPRQDFWMASMLINKFREFIIATRLEQVYSKEDLLTFYINTVPFGENIFGLDAAADRYYSKTADQLNIEECAMLVGLLKATSYYNPNNFPERALQRRNVVLHQMQVNNVIDSLTYDSLSALPLNLSYRRNTDSEGIALYFRNHIRPFLLEWCETHFKPDGQPYNLSTDGLRIFTTIDYTMQQYAEEAVKIHLTKLQESFDTQFDDWTPYDAPVRDAMMRSPRYEALKSKGLSEEQILDSMNQLMPMKFWTWEGMKDTMASPMDSIRHTLKTLQGSIVAIDPKTGGVMAWVGGNDAQQFNIDYVLTERHPGSAFKPFVYATAIDQGMDPCTYFTNKRITYPEWGGWSPGNADGKYDGIYSMPGALAKSINTIAVQVILEAGIDNVIQKARRMGMKGEIERIPSVALGTAEVTLMELTSAYTTFLNRGNYKPSYYITRIEDQDGNVLEEFNPTQTAGVFKEETCGIILQMMANVVDRGTGAHIRYEGLDIKGAMAGKTGTTQFHSDGLFVGMSPKFLAGAWVGCFDRRVSFNSLRDGMGSKTALPVWGEFVKKLQADPKYKTYFNSYWPEEYKWINDCPWMLEESELTELGVDPNEPPRDSTYMGPRKFVIKEEKRSAIGKFFEGIFGKKEDEAKQKEEQRQ